MSTTKELESQLRKIKKECRELKTHVKFLTDRLELAHDRNADLRKKMMTMTIDDVVAQQKEFAIYQQKLSKDQEFIETFEKQTEVKLDSTGINNEKRT